MHYYLESAVVLSVIVVVGLLLTRTVRRERTERLRDQTRLRVVEGQLALLRGLLRISAAEHDARRQMREMDSEAFASATSHEDHRSS